MKTSISKLIAIGTIALMLTGATASAEPKSPSAPAPATSQSTDTPVEDDISIETPETTKIEIVLQDE